MCVVRKGGFEPPQPCIVWWGFAPHPTRALAGPPSPAPRPRGAHVRALPSSPDADGPHVVRKGGFEPPQPCIVWWGFAPHPTRALAGPPSPAPRPRGAHVRASPSSPDADGPHVVRKGGFEPPQPCIVWWGFAPHPTRALAGPPSPAPRPRGAHVRALPSSPDADGLHVVRKGGFEPPQPFGYRILNPARLPVPPLSHGPPCLHETLGKARPANSEATTPRPGGPSVWPRRLC